MASKERVPVEEKEFQTPAPPETVDKVYKPGEKKPAAQAGGIPSPPDPGAKKPPPKAAFVSPGADFDRALAFDLKWEGEGYENVPGDPGGPTKAGITFTDWAAFLRRHALPVPRDPEAVAEMDQDTIKQIYLEQYWQPVEGSDLPSPVDEALFDTAVNIGVAGAVTMLQKILGISVDGRMGGNTEKAAKNYVAMHGAVVLASALLARRTQYYHDLVAKRPALGKFMAGWLSRCADLARVIHGEA